MRHHQTFYFQSVPTLPYYWAGRGVNQTMGSFDYTCCVSGLPISEGDPVRFLLLTEHPYHKPAEQLRHIRDRWIPRIIPVKAKYNGYGTIEEYQTGPILDIVLDAFKLDLIERGVGDNPYHDVSIRKNMSFEKLLNALWEGRVLVIPNGARPWIKANKKKATPGRSDPCSGVPTMRRVSALLQKAGFIISDGKFAKGYMVDLLRHGFVRIRYEDFGDVREPLEKTRPALEARFSTMITTGTGYHPDNAELWVAPKPLTPNERYKSVFWHRPPRKHRCAVAQAMIREDVWQALCAVKLNTRKNGHSTVAAYRKAARKLWAEKSRIRAIPDPLEANMAAIQFPKACSENAMKSWVANEAVTGLWTATELMLDRHLTGPDLDYLLDTLGEFAFIQSVLSEVRYQWGPRSGGPQLGEWETHKNVLLSFTKLCQTKSKGK